MRRLAPAWWAGRRVRASLRVVQPPPMAGWEGRGGHGRQGLGSTSSMGLARLHHPSTGGSERARLAFAINVAPRSRVSYTSARDERDARAPGKAGPMLLTFSGCAYGERPVTTHCWTASERRIPYERARHGPAR